MLDERCPIGERFAEVEEVALDRGRDEALTVQLLDAVVAVRPAAAGSRPSVRF